MTYNLKIKYFIPLLVGILLVLNFPEASADSNFINTITDQYVTNMQSWHGPLLGYALRIFWLLALIDVVWTVGKLIFNKADFSNWAEEIIKQFLVLGTFYAILTHSGEWAPAVIQSFRIAGNTASGSAGGLQGLQPTDVFNAGIVICSTLLKNFSLTFDMSKMVETLALVFGGFIVLISFCIIAALEIVALLESYLFMYAGVLFLGFGGSRITADIAKRYLLGLISIGAKLFTIQLVIGLGIQLIQQWTDLVVASNGNLDLQVILQIVGGAVIMMLLAKMVPELSQSMVSGASFATMSPLVSSGAAIGSTATSAALGGVAIATAMFNPAMAAQFARSAGNHASEAFRHTTGHSIMNPMHGFERGQNQAESSFSGRRPFRGDLGQDRDIDSNKTASTNNNGNSIGI
jgi:type IV secretion system protein TrbL